MQSAPGDVHEITELANGLRVVTEHVPGVHSVSLGVWIAVGSRHEDDDSRGYAHFMEHLLFKGNDRIDAEAISRWFDSIGSDINAATTREYTVVHARVLERHVPSSLEVLGEMVLAPGLKPLDVDAEREVILEEIAMYEDSPSDIVHELADALVFAGHSLGMPIVGTQTSIKRSRSDDLARFHARHYDPAKIVVSAAGAVDHASFVEQVQAQFLGARSHPPRSVEADESIDDAEASAPGPHVPVIKVRRKETEQSHVVLVGRGITRLDDRRYAAAMLDTIFGNAPSSRLFTEIRERRGLAYSVYSFLSNHVDAGQFGVYVGVRPDRVATVLDLLRTQLDRATTSPPTAAEMQLASGHLEGRMLLSLESTTVRSNRLGASLALDMPIEPLEHTVEQIRRVTADDVLQLARELLEPSRLSIAAVAEDVELVRAAAQAAGFGAVRAQEPA